MEEQREREKQVVKSGDAARDRRRKKRDNGGERVPGRQSGGADTGEHRGDEGGKLRKGRDKTHVKKSRNKVEKHPVDRAKERRAIHKELEKAKNAQLGKGRVSSSRLRER